jgi:hypothetical protein
MSFIRCLSNPEGLYAFGGKGTMEFYWDRKDTECNANQMIVPWWKFQRAMRRYINSGHDLGKCEGFEIQEWFGRRLRGKVLHREKTRLSYKGAYVYLWSATWEYVVHNFQEKEIPRRTWHRIYKYFL